MANDYDGTGAMVAAWFGATGAGKAIENVFGGKKLSREDELFNALRELVAVKQMKEEVSRRKQRRKCLITRDLVEVAAVKQMHEDCKVRERRAWSHAQALIKNL